VGRTEKHKYDFRDHSRRLQVICDAHPKEFIGVKLQQTDFLTGLDKDLDKGLVHEQSEKEGTMYTNYCLWFYLYFVRLEFYDNSTKNIYLHLYLPIHTFC